MQNDSKIKQVLKWIEYADEDLRVTEIVFSLSSNVPYRIIAYHSQQCAEKYLKAFLLYHNVDFPYTHNISTLIELCLPFVDLNEKLSLAKELSKYAVAVRYPTDYLTLNKKETIRLIKIAQKVKTVIRKLLVKENPLFKEKL
ncbi:MAG: HEPN domain-containing protein [Ignavibacterium sp.]|jgi:HEPN domain-containing protein|nr:HEPN domain-containing protein [Ignavibacterium sp.]